ncbi:MAG: hypothetical protein QME63_06565 [Actinomycetota bacterium]|nr:hypothetical protein [Actinomycetota bacterium]
MRNFGFRNIAYIIILLLLVMVMVITLTNVKVISGGHAFIVQSIDEAPNAQAAIVLGARVLVGTRFA